MNTVLITFTPHLQEDELKKCFQLSKFAEGALGDFPHYITPAVEFDKELLKVYIQDDYIKSKGYVEETRRIAKTINESYYSSLGTTGDDIRMRDFESELGLLDDHIVTINEGDTVLGFICTEDDFNKIINEL